MRARLLLFVLVALAACQKPPRREGAITVAAASDLALAFYDIGEAWAKTGHTPPVFTFGSTGLLAKQIAEGAPFDVYAAANVSFVDDVVRDGHCDPGTRALYARGRIAIFTRRPDAGGAAPPPPRTLEELASPAFVRIAIANPEHAPYGRAAEQALARSGLLAAVKPKLVYGENVRQAMQFAQTGNAEAAVVALSLATTAGGAFTPVPAELHDPIDQALVVCSRDRARADSARAFALFVAAPEGRAIMRRYGFLLPGEAID